MPLGLGFFAAAGASAAPVGDYELIQTAFGNGSSTTVTFSSIPSTYVHLELRWSATTSTNVSMSLYPNGDNSSVKPYHRIVGSSGSISAGGFTNQIAVPLQATNSGTATSINSGILQILDYRVAKNKTIRALHLPNGGQVYMSTSLWINTAAITSLTFDASSAFTTNARFSLYGIKG